MLSVAPIRASLGLAFPVAIVALLSVSPVTPENDFTKFKHSEDLATMHEEFFLPLPGVAGQYKHRTPKQCEHGELLTMC